MGHFLMLPEIAYISQKMLLKVILVLIYIKTNSNLEFIINMLLWLFISDMKLLAVYYKDMLLIYFTCINFNRTAEEIADS